MSVLAWLLDATAFETRSHCGEWPAWLALVYQLSSLVLALAYLFLPVCIFVLWGRRRNDVAHRSILACFAAFVCADALTHLADFLVFWWAPYRLFVLVLAVAAALALATSLMLPGVAIALLKLPSRAFIHKINNQLHAEMALRQLAELDLKEERDQLRTKVEHLQDLLRDRLWYTKRTEAIDELETMLDSTKGSS